MLLELVDLEVRDGFTPALEAALCEVRQRVFSSAGFRGFDVAQDAADPALFVVQVRWESAEELARHTATRFERCWDPVQPLLARAPRVRHLVQREGLGLHGPGVVDDLGWLRADAGDG
ncbi:MAG: antibiotic biosynthesis monooxygenase family protein [Kineosporiaceae bacterium]